MTVDRPTRYRAGDTIERRKVLHGRVWLTHPVTVVRDTGDELAVHLQEGSRFTFPDHPFGAHPWAHQTAWAGTDVLQLYRPDDLYSVWRFYRNGIGANWYINFEAEIVRLNLTVCNRRRPRSRLILTAGRRWWSAWDEWRPSR